MKFLLTNLLACLLFSFDLVGQETDDNEAYHQKLETWKKQKEAIEKQNQEKVYSKMAKEKFNTANALYRQGNYSAAVVIFQEAIKLDPHYQKAYTNLGLACKQMGDYQNALRYYDAAITMKDGDKVIVEKTMGYKLSALLEIRDFEKAIETSRSYLKQDSTDATILYSLVYSYNATGQSQEAIGQALLGLKLSNSEEITAAFNFELGEAYGKIGRISEAIQCYRHSMQNEKWKDMAEDQIRILETNN